VLYQSGKHGVGKKLGDCDGAPMGALQSEARAFQLLKGAGLDVVEVYIPPGPGVGSHMRVALKKRTDGDARAAIAIILGSMLTVKHVFVCDEDIDVHLTSQVEWAMASRFQADQDIVVMHNMQLMPMDLSAPKRGIGSKAGFDLTFPYPRAKSVTMRVPEAPHIEGPARFQTVSQALATGPMHFAKLMSVLGSRDGREIVLEIERLRDEGRLERNDDGEYYLKN
jgi:2,5-furandicarboxylate decarboxylase 1